MQKQVFARTNKAEFFRLPDGSLLKQYFPDKNPADKARQDQHSLRRLGDDFGEVYYESWVYRAVKVLDVVVDQGAVRLEFVPGTVLSDLPKSKMKEAEYHCGIWLALYHNKLLNGRLEGLIYWDFNVHNVIIDFERRTVTAIDPGMSWGRTGYACQDLVRHIHSGLMTLVVKRKSPALAFLSFLKGYTLATQSKPNLTAYYKGLWREIRRQFYLYFRKSYVKLMLYPFVLSATFALYFCFVPGYLLLKGFERSRNVCKLASR